MAHKKMVRKQIYLQSEQNNKIKLLSSRHGKTEAEIIREAIDRYMAKEHIALNDPLEDLIGMIDDEQADGSLRHDDVVYLDEGEDL